MWNPGKGAGRRLAEEPPAGQNKERSRSLTTDEPVAAIAVCALLPSCFLLALLNCVP